MTMNCIICQDNTDDVLYNNIDCSCNYMYHKECWDKYKLSINYIKCPMCRQITNKTQHTVIDIIHTTDIHSGISISICIFLEYMLYVFLLVCLIFVIILIIINT